MTLIERQAAFVRITILAAAIKDSKDCPPGHCNYLNKSRMADIGTEIEVLAGSLYRELAQ